MNNITRKIVIDFISSKSYMILLILLLAATWVFTSFNTFNSDYIININYSLVSHKNLYTFLVYPILVIFIVNLYYTISKNINIILRIKNKKEYFKVQVQSSILLTTIFFIEFLIIIIISINLNRTVNFNIIKDDSNVANIIVLLVNMFKIYMQFMTIQFISLVFINIFKNKQTSIITIFIYILYVHMSYKLESIPIIKYILPSSHTYSYILYNNLLTSILSSLIYYTITLLFLYIISKKIIIKTSIEKEVLS